MAVSSNAQLVYPSFKQCHVGYAWDEPTSSRYSNHECSGPDTAQLKDGAARERKMNDSDERCSGKHSGPASGTGTPSPASMQ